MIEDDAVIIAREALEKSGVVHGEMSAAWSDRRNGREAWIVVFEALPILGEGGLPDHILIVYSDNGEVEFVRGK